jgi:excinuclease ABC subunit C
MGPCEGEETEAEYNQKIEQIKNILRGNFASVKRHFKEEMERLASELAFEKAQQIKEKLNAFEDYQSKSTVVSTTIHDVDVFSISSGEQHAYINYLKVVNGAIIHTHIQEVVKNLDEDETDILAFGIPELRERFQSQAPEIILAQEVPLSNPGIKITIPQIGDKRKLLDLSVKNVKYYRLQKQKQEASHTKRQTSAERILRTLQKDLQMDTLPIHLECFDNSNIQGSHPVASCVVFKNAQPSKKDYRHFNIKTVEGPNDFASMEEVVYRRYKRLCDEEQPLPQLVIIDGGKGQLSSAMKSIRMLGLEHKITVVGIAKRLEEIFFPDDSIPLYIDKKSESLKLIQHARNEAHRFAINFHRDQRSRNFTATELTQIQGIGEKTAQKLLSHFGSVKKIRAASPTDLSEVVSANIVQKLLTYFAQTPGDN